MAHLVLIAGLLAFVFIQFTISQGQDQGACQNAYNTINQTRCITGVIDQKSQSINIIIIDSIYSVPGIGNRDYFTHYAGPACYGSSILNSVD